MSKQNQMPSFLSLAACVQEVTEAGLGLGIRDTKYLCFPAGLLLASYAGYFSYEWPGYKARLLQNSTHQEAYSDCWVLTERKGCCS